MNTMLGVTEQHFFGQPLASKLIVEGRMEVEEMTEILLKIISKQILWQFVSGTCNNKIIVQKWQLLQSNLLFVSKLMAVLIAYYLYIDW